MIVFAVANSASVWLIVYAASFFAGGLVLVGWGGPGARRAAILSQVAAIVSIAVVQWQLFERDAAYQLAGLTLPLALAPITALGLLLADHYLLSCRATAAGAGSSFRIDGVLSRAVRLMGCLLMLAASIGTIAYVILPMKTQLDSLAWPTTQGKIVRVEVVPSAEPGGCWWACSTHDRLEVEYAYNIDGAERVGQRIDAFDQVTMGYSPDRMKRFISGWPVGAVLPVAYHPADSDRSLLRPGIDAPQMVSLLGVMIFFAVFASSLVGLVRREYVSINASAAESSSPAGVVSESVLITFGLASFVSAATIFLATGGEPGVLDAAAAWLLAVGGTLMAWLYFRKQAAQA
ncbi:MAG: DUF3592 domain-containing protein [Planctomycetota bacterium]